MTDIKKILEETKTMSDFMNTERPDKVKANEEIANKPFSLKDIKVGVAYQTYWNGGYTIIEKVGRGQYTCFAYDAATGKYSRWHNTPYTLAEAKKHLMRACYCFYK